MLSSPKLRANEKDLKINYPADGYNPVGRGRQNPRSVLHLIWVGKREQKGSPQGVL